MKNNSLLSLGLLLLLGIIWGTGYSLARFAMTHEVPALGYSFWQSLGPALLISGLTYWKKKSLTPFSTSYLRYYFVCGLTGIVIPNTTMYFAAAHLPAGLLAVIVNTVPIIAYSLALCFRIEKFDGLRFSGIGCALTGLMLIILPQATLPSANMLPWILITLLTPLSFAFCSIYIARYQPRENNSLQLAAGTLIFSSLILFPLVLWNDNFYRFHFPLTSPDCVILLEIILSSIGYILLFQLIKMAGPVYYSLVDTIVALTGLSWGYFLFNETLNKWTALAVTLILLGLLFVTQRQKNILTSSNKGKYAETILTSSE